MNDDLKDRVRLASPIVDVISGYMPLRPAGKEFRGVCPFHDDTNPSLTVSSAHENYRCWSCGARGDVFKFVQEYEKITFPEALRKLAERAGITYEQTRGPVDPHERQRKALMWAAEQYSRCLFEADEGQKARLYLSERGLSGTINRQFGLGYAPSGWTWLVDRANAVKADLHVLEQVDLVRQSPRGWHDRFCDRLLFPIRDSSGKVIGFGGRVMPGSDATPKYLNTSATDLFRKSETLYGLDIARRYTGADETLIVVEGYVDVVAAHDQGIKNVVGTMGTAVTSAHAAILARHCKRVVCLFDADAGGSTGVEKALQVFSPTGMSFYVGVLHAGQDPADVLASPDGVKVFRKAVSDAVDGWEFYTRSLLTETTSEATIDAVLELIASAPGAFSDAVRQKQQLAVHRLSQAVGVSHELLAKQLAKLSPVRDTGSAPTPKPTAGPPPESERRLIQGLLNSTDVAYELAEFAGELDLERITHPGLRRLFAEIRELCWTGGYDGIKSVLARLVDRRDLSSAARSLAKSGQNYPDPAGVTRRAFGDIFPTI